MWVKLTVGDETIRLTKEEYLRIINDKPDEELKCEEVVELFKEVRDDEH